MTIPRALFALFYRAPHTAKRASGTGIGLYVTSQLLEAMGSSISAGTNGDARRRVPVPPAARPRRGLTRPRTAARGTASAILIRCTRSVSPSRRASTWPSTRGSPRRPAATRSPFVLVHGLASNARMWDGVACELSDRGHLAVTVDLRGHGRSAKPDGPYDMATVADDVARA